MGGLAAVAIGGGQEQSDGGNAESKRKRECGEGVAHQEEALLQRDAELDTIERRIADAEKELQAKHDIFLDPAIMSDGTRLHAVSLEMDAAQKTIDQLYARWSELEQKKN